MKNKTIVVLGGAGFIGGHLISYLLNSTQVNVISIGRGAVNIDHKRLKHYTVNISFDSICKLDINTLDVLAFINCAGGGSVQESHQAPLLDFYKTTCSTAEVLEYIRINTPNSKYVQLSTAAVYGNCFTFPIKVDSPLNPISSYGYNNLMAENLVQFYSTIYGVKATILRVFSVYGEGLRKQILWDACTKINKGDTSFFGTGQEVRDFINVHDLVATIFNSIQLASDIVPIYNCGSGEGKTINNLLKLVASHFDNAPEVKFTGEAKIGDPLGYVADISNSPAQVSVSIDNGIDSYVNWFKMGLSR